MGSDLLDDLEAPMEAVSSSARPLPRGAGPKVADGYYAGNQELPAHARSDCQALRERLTPDANGIIMALVGLPARGKSFISRKVERFLEWRGLKTRMFNVGRYRRDATAAQESGRSSFFDPDNKAAFAMREAASREALTDALAFLDGGGRIAILDATNSTVARRKRILEQVSAHSQSYCVIFVEAFCDDAEILDINMRSKVSNSPDFVGLSQEEALTDLKKRIAKYEEVYETVQDNEGPFIKLYNLSSKVLANHCYGRVSKSVLPYVMAIHVGSRPIWLVRAGAGQDNPQSPSTTDRLAKLSSSGRNFAVLLSAFVRARAERYWKGLDKPQEPTHVVTSTISRAVASVCYTTLQHEQSSALNPIDKGAIGTGWWDVECRTDTPPWEELESRHPEFYAQWRQDPLRVRFPGGESYMDVMKRLEGMLIEVEMCTRPVLIVSHITTLQLLIAYFRGVPIEEAWQIPVHKNKVLEILPTSGGGFMCESHDLTPETTEASPISHLAEEADEALDAPWVESKRQRIAKDDSA